MVNDEFDPLEGETLISATRLRLRKHAPFFATLALFAEVRFTQQVTMAATDGCTLYFNPNAFNKLSPPQRDGLFLHELLHAALLHPMRRGIRLNEPYNVAADIVVNGMIIADGNTELPDGGIRVPEWEHFSVEEIYELLMQQKKQMQCPISDLIQQPLPCPNSMGKPDDGKANLSQKLDLEAHWKQAIHQAHMVASNKPGSIPLGVSRHLLAVAEPQIDWRTQLWRYLVRTPNDYSGFDRRFFYQGLYLDCLEGESVEVFCCIYNSGSVGEEELSIFLGELKGILSAYPMLKCWLWYADASCYGPYPLDLEGEIPPPEGGGGTDFRPFFDAIAATWGGQNEAVCVYLTDGYGDFPEKIPQLPILWVIIPGGLDTDEFPYGEVVRLQSKPVM